MKNNLSKMPAAFRNAVIGKPAKKAGRSKKGHWADEPAPPLRDANGKVISKKGMFDTSDWFWK